MTKFATTLTFLFICIIVSSNASAIQQSSPSEETEDTSEEEVQSFIDNDYFQTAPELEFERPDEAIQERIAEMESNHGPFYSAISDELLALGKLYVEQNKPELAYNTFKRSLEIHRMNDGLYGRGQFPIVRQLILTNSMLGEWRNVNKYYDYLYWLHRRIFDRNSPEMLPILEELIAWKIQAINRRLTVNIEATLDDTRRTAKAYNNILKAHPELEKEPIYLRISDNSLQRSRRSSPW